MRHAALVYLGLSALAAATAPARAEEAPVPIGVPARVTDEVAARLKAKVGLPRERFVVCSTHTHCGPALSGSLGFIFGGPIPADQEARIDGYTRSLTDALERVALDA